MPARKSCASRIIGDREVRPMEVSTSFSIAASVPATISTRTGSAATFGRWGTSRSGCRWGTSSLARLLRHQQVAVGVHGDAEAWVDRNGGAELLDDGRAVHHVA